MTEHAIILPPSPLPRVLPCIVCGMELGRELGRGGTRSAQPAGALTFTGPGRYGSTSDPMDASQALAVNVCDGCLRAAAAFGRVSLLTYPERARIEPSVQPWIPEEA